MKIKGSISNLVFFSFIIPICYLFGLVAFPSEPGPTLSAIIMSIASSLLAAGTFAVLVDNRLKELIGLDEEITVILVSESGREVKCPLISRKDFNRSEVLGYIGMLGGPERFEIKYIKTPEFGNQIRKVQKSKGNQELRVKCTDKELDQFVPQ
ncbi:hypothetical protein BZJ19_04740 [Salinivibrio proteolyticus]|uniref:hypothetical protein n=1 Tax=Salinivibrio proteolyticus TaxID=334715 RepID=UPI00098961C7|nr:hypothetical protein [Salinivibrio proteolyticus]OOF26438.1 hypothetical protein BZJ19_04740 [Salinivibrio proteolyticus]